jgi:hypothetical protein
MQNFQLFLNVPNPLILTFKTCQNAVFALSLLIQYLQLARVLFWQLRACMKNLMKVVEAKGVRIVASVKK